jgi:hypothetical protein
LLLHVFKNKIFLNDLLFPSDVLQVYLQKLSQMMSHEEDLDLYSKSAPVKRRKRNPGGNPSQKRPYYGELEDFDLGKGDPHIIFI